MLCFHSFLGQECPLIFFLLLFLLLFCCCSLCKFLFLNLFLFFFSFFLNLFLKCWCLSGFCPRSLVFLLYVSSESLPLLTPVASFTFCVYKAPLYYRPTWLSWTLDQKTHLCPRHLHLGVFSNILTGTELLTSPSPNLVHGTTVKAIARPATWELFFIPYFLYYSLCQLFLLPNML